MCHHVWTIDVTWHVTIDVTSHVTIDVTSRVTIDVTSHLTIHVTSQVTIDVTSRVKIDVTISFASSVTTDVTWWHIYFKYLAAQSVLMWTLFSDLVVSLLFGSFENGRCVGALFPVTPLVKTYLDTSDVDSAIGTGFESIGFFVCSLPPNPPKSGRLRNDGRYLVPIWRCFPNPFWPFVVVTLVPLAAI